MVGGRGPDWSFGGVSGGREGRRGGADTWVLPVSGPVTWAVLSRPFVLYDVV